MPYEKGDAGRSVTELLQERSPQTPDITGDNNCDSFLFISKIYHRLIIAVKNIFLVLKNKPQNFYLGKSAAPDRVKQEDYL